MSVDFYDTNKGFLAQKLLCRWWYAIEWPKKDQIGTPPPGFEPLDGFPGVFVSTRVRFTFCVCICPDVPRRAQQSFTNRPFRPPHLPPLSPRHRCRCRHQTDSLGVIKDLRDKSSCPCLKNFAKMSSAELQVPHQHEHHTTRARAHCRHDTL
jgi:hypothetical protein